MNIVELQTQVKQAEASLDLVVTFAREAQRRLEWALRSNTVTTQMINDLEALLNKEDQCRKVFGELLELLDEARSIKAGVKINN